MNFPPSTSQTTQQLDWTKELPFFEDSFITEFLKPIYCDKNIRFEDARMLQNVRVYKEDKKFRWWLIASILRGDRQGALNAKVLHCTSMLFGTEEAARIFACFIHLAKNAEEFTRFLSFALTLIPHFCQSRLPNEQSCMTLAVRYALLESRQIEEEMEKLPLPPRDPLEKYLVQNLLMLIKWQEQSEEGAPLKHIGLNLADIRGQLQEGLINWALDYTELVRKRTGGSLDQISSNVLNNLFSLMHSVIPQVQLPICYLNNLFVKISALFISLLKFIVKEQLGTPLDGIDFFSRACVISGRIFQNQSGVAGSQLLRAFTDEIFGSYSMLFETANATIDLNSFIKHRSAREVGAQLDFGRFKKIDFLHANKNEHSIFKELRQMTLEEKSAAAVAHSGVLTRKRQAKQALHQEQNSSPLDDIEIGQIRRLLVVDFIECLCIAKPPPSSTEFYNLNMCRHLGQFLVDRFAGDGLTSHSHWFAWEQERELIAQYIEVSKSIDKYPIVFDFLLILSDVGFQGLCFVLPLVKAVFVAVLGQLENTPLKNERVSRMNLEKCTQLLSLFISADFFPSLLIQLHAILSKCNNYEAFLLMRDLWSFTHQIVVANLDATHQQRRITVDPSYLKKKEGAQLVSSMVLVIQRNLTLLGTILPSLTEMIGGENDEDDWSIARNHKPIAVVAEIKR